MVIPKIFRSHISLGQLCFFNAFSYNIFSTSFENRNIVRRLKTFRFFLETQQNCPRVQEEPYGAS